MSVDSISGAPEALHSRIVRIYKPSKTGMADQLMLEIHLLTTKQCNPEFKEQSCGEWTGTPLRRTTGGRIRSWVCIHSTSTNAFALKMSMVRETTTDLSPGWASSGDFMQGTSLKFASSDDAIAFAEKQGWDYFLQTPHMQEFHPKSYSSNFTRTQMNPKKSKHILSQIELVAHQDSCTYKVVKYKLARVPGHSIIDSQTLYPS